MAQELLMQMEAAIVIATMSGTLSRKAVFLSVNKIFNMIGCMENV